LTTGFAESSSPMRISRLEQAEVLDGPVTLGQRVAAFVAAAIPPLTAQTSALVHQLPHYKTTVQDHSSTLGRLNTRFHVQQRLSTLLSSKGTALVGGVLRAGALVLSAASSMLVVIVLVVYFLAAMPRIKLFAYRLAPQSRRARVILIGDEIFDKVGGYMLGNFLTSLIAGVGTYAIPLRLLLHEVTFRRLDTS
jgi:predicted PurR-regulated permease PerM